MPLGKMGVEGLQSILVTHYDQVAICRIIFRHPDLARKHGVYRVSGGEGQVDALVAPAVPVAETGIDPALVRALVGHILVNETEYYLVRKV